MYKDQDGILIDAYQVTAERYYMSLNVGKRGLALAKIGDWITHTFGLPENESFLYSDITFKEKFTLLFPPMDPNIIHIYHAVDKAELTN